MTKAHAVPDSKKTPSDTTPLLATETPASDVNDIKVDRVKKEVVLKKMRQMWRLLTFIVQESEEKIAIAHAWLTKGSGEKYQEKIKLFNQELAAILLQYNAKPLYFIALKGNFFSEGLFDGKTILLAKFFDTYPEILNFFYDELTRPDSVLEKADKEFSEGLDLSREFVPLIFTLNKTKKATDHKQVTAAPNLTTLNKALKKMKFEQVTSSTTATVTICLQSQVENVKSQPEVVAEPEFTRTIAVMQLNNKSLAHVGLNKIFDKLMDERKNPTPLPDNKVSADEKESECCSGCTVM